LVPPGVLTSTSSPSSLPINALARGEFMLSRAFSRSASASPTIWYVISFSVSSKNRVVFAPNFIGPLSFEHQLLLPEKL